MFIQKKFIFILFIFFVPLLGANILHLKAGWNLIGSNQNDINVTKTFSLANTIWKYNNEKWYVSSPNGVATQNIEELQLDTFSIINSGDGFWVNLPQSMDINLTGTENSLDRNISLNNGWNLVSLKIDNDIDTMDYFNNDNIQIIWKYNDNNWSAYSSNAYVQDAINNNSNVKIIDTIKVNDGFWILSDNAMELSFDENISSTITFISSSNVTVSENQVSALTLSVTGGDNLVYSISGADADKFNIDSSTGVITFKTSPDYETKTSYNFTAKVTDGNTEVTQDITINIENAYEESPFITIWQVTSDNLDIVIPINSYYDYDYTVYWGDGDVENYTNQKAIHTYNEEGNYTVKIAGNFPHLDMIITASEEEKLNASQLLYVTQWGNIEWKSMSKTFAFCKNLELNATDIPNLSAVNSTYYMFTGVKKINSSISDWNVSNITNMKGMFGSAKTFNQDISSWDVSNVTDMSWMFAYTDTFNVDISDWNVSNVTNMNAMFKSAIIFNQDISSWDVSNVTDMSFMFSNAKLFNQDISTWDVSHVLNMEEMFSGAKVFNQDISSWAVDNVSNMRGIFADADAFNQDISDWIVENVTDMSYMFADADAFNQDISLWDVGNVIDMSGMFSGTSSFNQDLSWEDIGSVTKMASMFSNAKVFNQDISDWELNNITTMKEMFSNADSFNQDISTWDVSHVTDMSGMFKYADIFNQDISDWNVSNVTDMSLMFNGNVVFDQNISNWDVGNVTNMRGMFLEANGFNQDISNWDVSNVTNMDLMFRGADSFSDHNLSSWNVIKVTTHIDFITETGGENIEPNWEQ